jgi:hypothetical protein
MSPKLIARRPIFDPGNGVQERVETEFSPEEAFK